VVLRVLLTTGLAGAFLWLLATLAAVLGGIFGV
jgi:hypothetical protein